MKYSNINNTTLLGYESADITVHPPPPNCRELVHFFRISVYCSQKMSSKESLNISELFRFKDPKILCTIF